MFPEQQTSSVLNHLKQLNLFLTFKTYQLLKDY